MSSHRAGYLIIMIGDMRKKENFFKLQENLEEHQEVLIHTSSTMKTLLCILANTFCLQFPGLSVIMTIIGNVTLNT